jgi:small redox-active disulfide protein 2
MYIKLLGSGCPNCKRLEKLLLQAKQELNMEFTLEKVTKMDEIIQYGVMGTPALIVDDTLLFNGRVPNLKTLKELLISQKI